jgi:hypothetical protein
MYVREDGKSAVISGLLASNGSYQERHEIDLQTWEEHAIPNKFKPVEDYEEFKCYQDPEGK